MFGRLLSNYYGRFPGQYYSSESTLHYNYFRDYDPTTCRYIESDPIGLGGGINLYGYAHQNPLAFTDPTGQFVPVLFLALTPEAVTAIVTVVGAAWTFYARDKAETALAEAHAVRRPKPPSTREAANEPYPKASNDPTFGGGGDGCPPECERLRKELDKQYKAIYRMITNPTPGTESSVKFLRAQFQKLVRELREKCGSYEKELPPNARRIG